MDKSKEDLIERLLEAEEEVLYLEEQYSDSDVVDRLVSILENEYDL